jgi:hypothetical protein
LFTRCLARANLALVRVLRCDIWRSLFSCDGIQRRHHRSPTVAASPAGRDPARATRPVNGSDTDAPFATEVQSFLPSRFDGCLAELSKCSARNRAVRISSSRARRMYRGRGSGGRRTKRLSELSGNRARNRELRPLSFILILRIRGQGR